MKSAILQATVLVALFRLGSSLADASYVEIVQEASSIPSASEAIAIYRAAIQSIRSFDLVLSVEAKYGEGTPANKRHGTRYPEMRQYRQIREGTNFRVDCYSARPPGKLVKVTVTDRESSKTLNYGQMKAIIDSPGEFSLEEGMSYEQLYATTELNFLIDSVLSSRPNTRVSIITKNERKCLAIDSPPDKQSELNVVGLRLYLDYSNGLLPMQLDRYRVVDGKELTYYACRITRFRRLADRSCVPAAAIIQHFGIADPVNPLMQYDLKVDENQSTWNLPIDKSRFSLSFPTGTTVADRLRKYSYVVGQSDMNANLGHLAQRGKEILGEEPIVPTARSQLAFLRWLAPSLLVAVATVYLIGRRLRK